MQKQSSVWGPASAAHAGGFQLPFCQWRRGDSGQNFKEKKK